MNASDTSLTVAEAEATLKSLIAAGASDAEIDAASVAVLDAQDAEQRTGERELVQRRIAGEVRLEESAAKRRARDQKTDDAERAMIATDAPTVTLKSGAVSVVIKLAAGRDAHLRLVLVEAVKLAVHELDKAFLERIGRVRAGTSGDARPEATASFMAARLRDELRYALKAIPSAITIECDSSIAGAAAPSGAPTVDAAGSTLSPAPAILSIR